MRSGAEALLHRTARAAQLGLEVAVVHRAPCASGPHDKSYCLAGWVGLHGGSAGSALLRTRSNVLTKDVNTSNAAGRFMSVA